MPAIRYYFPSDPQFREKLAKMSAEDRKKRLHKRNIMQRKYRAILENRLRKFLEHRERLKDQLALNDKV